MFPTATSFAPSIYRASSLARNSAVSAISLESPIRPGGTRSDLVLDDLDLPRCAAAASVQGRADTTGADRVDADLRSRSSRDQLRAGDLTAALEAESSENPGRPTCKMNDVVTITQAPSRKNNDPFIGKEVTMGAHSRYCLRA